MAKQKYESRIGANVDSYLKEKKEEKQVEVKEEVKKVVKEPVSFETTEEISKEEPKKEVQKQKKIKKPVKEEGEGFSSLTISFTKEQYQYLNLVKIIDGKSKQDFISELIEADRKKHEKEYKEKWLNQ